MPLTVHYRKPFLKRALLGCAGACLLFCFGPVDHAQDRTTLRRVEIVGLQRLSSDEVLAATGLKVGDAIDRPAIDAAAAKLMRSGWFTSVRYNVRTAEDDSTVIFEVAEKASPSVSNDALGQVSWNGNRAFTNQELTTAFGLRPGEAAARAKIDVALDAVRKAYGRRGYINAQITEASARDAATHRLNYDFTIREGQQYRMGALTIAGLSAGEAQQLKSKWTLAANSIFDDSYLDQFRATVIRPFIASRTQRTGIRSKFDLSTQPDTQKQTVDVIITFK